MKKRTFVYRVSLCLLVFFLSFGCAQKENVEKASLPDNNRDRAVYKTEQIDGKETTYLTMDYTRIERPASIEEFTRVSYLPPIQQYKTLSCWCFATTSFLEAEMARMGKEPVKLSEMYTVYWEFVEKARRFVREKGNSVFSGGSEPNAVIERMKVYGAVPATAYTGLLPGKTEHDHTALFEEMDKYLQTCKSNNFWNEEEILANIKKILNKHLGEPPQTVEVDGKAISPVDYLKNVLQLPLDDYVAVMSFTYLPFYTKGEFKVPDNWWHSQEYYNVPLDDYYQAILQAIKNGYSLVLSVDFTEPGNIPEANLGVIPDFDVPRDYINQDSRELRFFNSATTDDHGLHLVGYKETPKDTWFLVKDSWSTAYVGKVKGYFFYRDDYVKLKSLAFLVHKDALKDLLARFKAN